MSESREKRVQVVGEPPVLHRPPVHDETDSENEKEVEEQHFDEVHTHEDEDDGEGMDELMSAFEDNERELDLTHLRIKSTKHLNLSRFSQTLERLNLRQNEIYQMRGKDLSCVPHLKELDLYDNSIEHIAGLDGNEELEVLDLSFNNIRHVSRITHLGRCHTLYLVQNKIARLRPTDFTGPISVSLRSLELGGNRLRSLDNLSHLSNLEELWVGKNKITSLESNRLTKLEGLDTLEALEELYLSHNGIQKLEGLDKNLNLTTLDFASNQVVVIENVSHLKKLSQFWANDNKIDDINHLDAQLGPQNMPELETVYLEGNPAQKAEASSYRRKVQLALPQIQQLDATYVQKD
ncbi:protein phosphatase regulatory subunit Sds22 [Malassezia caprae]|uniref:Protein phosphatase regulatory subunit Sds22 n=1 Tax=Malassezia caprae TaxID=1381934 RepID=A0AAF0IZ71_9BASI|nr:protein phosphatase regulatory subunit Sds22 [Malassezia caprae]